MTNIQLEPVLRPCYIVFKKHRKKALFHRWSHESEIVEPSPMIGGHNGGIIDYTVAIVETEDGQIDKVPASRVKFCDNIFEQYCFDERR